MQSVATGTLIGRITDAFGNVTHELRAPFAGVVLYVVATPPVSEGEPLVFVGQLAEAGAEPKR
jgi:predicted deacylase